MHKFAEAGIEAQRFEPGIYEDKGEPDRVFSLSAIEPFKRVVRLTNRTINNCNFIGRNPLLGSVCEDFLQDFARLFLAAYGSQHLRSFCLRGGRLAGKDALLFEGRERLIVHALFLIGPTQHRVG